MKSSKIYVIINRKEKSSVSYRDRTQAASLLGIHANTLQYRLKDGYYNDDEYIVILSELLPSNRHKR